MAEEEEETKVGKWQGKSSVELKSLTADQVWPCLQDFCNVHNWLPSIDTCYQVEGVPGQPGLTRYCSATKPPHHGGSDETILTTNWANEKLLTINPIERCFSYEVLDNNVGFKSYVATIKVVPIDGGDAENGCIIEWSFVSDPVDGWRFEDLVSYVDYCLQFMANKMKQVLLPTI